MIHRKAGLACAALSVFFAGTTLLWLRLDRSPPTWDDAFYLTGSLKMYDALSEGGLAGYGRQFLTVMGSKPPLIAVLPTPLYLMLGRRPRAAYGINLVFLLVMFSALYRMGRRHSSSRAGLLAVYISGTMPILYGLSRWFLVECGLTAIVCVTICLLAEWNDFAGPWKGFLLGAICGLGALMKASFPVYILIPLLYFAIRERRAVLRSGTLPAFAAAALAVAAPWYLLNFRRALATAVSAGSAETAKLYQTADVFSLSGIESYLGNLLNAGPALYFAALLLLLPVIRKASPTVRRALFLCGLWGSPVVFLVFGHYRELRYAAPLFPALALAVALLIDAALAGRAAAASATALGLLLLPLLSMLQTSFGWLGAWRPELGGLLFRAPKLAYAGRYDPAGWPHAEILGGIYSTARFAGGERKTLLVGTDSAHFNADNFALAALQGKMPFSIDSTAYETDLKALLPVVDRAAYFVFEEGGEPVAPFFNIHGGAARQKVLDSGRFVELPLARKLPDGGVVHVFENRSLSNGAFVGANLGHIKDCAVTFAGMLQLTGLSGRLTPAGLEVKYRWRCLKPVDRDYWCFTHILDENGYVAGYLDHPILNGDPPMTAWKEGDVAIERLVFPIPAPQGGAYRLRLGVFHKDSGDRLPISASNLPVTDQGTAALAGPGDPP